MVRPLRLNPPNGLCPKIQCVLSATLRREYQLVGLQRHRRDILVPHALGPNEGNVPMPEYRSRPKLPSGLNVPSLDVCPKALVVWHDVADALVSDRLDPRWCYVLRQ